MPYDLIPDSDTGQIVEAINYLLNNLNNGLNADPSTGQVIGPNNQVVGYLYKYLAVKYADSFDGSVNFSDSPTNRQYYGLRNSDSSVESTNPADYIWTQVTGGFGTTKLLYYSTTGGRQIDLRVDTTLPAVEWAPAPTAAIDLDIVTSGSVLSTTFVAFFQPSTLQVPYTTAPNFTGVVAKLYASNSQGYVTFSTAQTDSDVSFTNNTWRIGNSATTGNGDISYANITVGSPTDGGGYAQWPIPTAMSASPALITAPVRYKNSNGVVSQASPASIQITFSTSGSSSRLAFARIPGNPTPISGTIQTAGSASYPTSGQSASVWGISTVWSGIDPNPASTDSLYQSEGSYDPATNLTTWTTPYISSLRVGTLSAITVNTGSLSVTGDLTIGTTGAIKGGQTAYNTGTGFFLGYSGATYKFSIGNSSVNMLWDGSSFTVNGGDINGSAINGGTIKIGSGSTPSGNALEVTSGGTVYSDNLFTKIQFAELPTGSQQFDDGAAINASAYNSSTGYTKVALLGICPNSSGTTQYVHGLKAANYKVSTNSIGIVGTYLGYDFYAAGAATNYGPFTGAHDAVMTPEQYNNVELGDIVYDVTCLIRKNLSNTLFEVNQTTTANDQRAIGVVVLKKDLVANNIPAACIESEDYINGQTIYTYFPKYYEIKDTYYSVNMNAVGEGMINVCGQNGDIASGNLIVSSSIPGKGMKQADDIVRTITVAKAREDMTFSSPTEVKQIACIYLCG